MTIPLANVSTDSVATAIGAVAAANMCEVILS